MHGALISESDSSIRESDSSIRWSTMPVSERRSFKNQEISLMAFGDAANE